ncbi:hypothetical protein N658DRAFT_541657 [Parathielavia hyrcaniae]|uniref:Uncharacterized protein n=1 Tax=Parathielavia hyrcaniae TaxID=113614 RepID=A0AAN6QC88_9PEZI|nr:hypothetical protein N658DRAFT_541657 [Parathielavia hyrcaniae]
MSKDTNKDHKHRSNALQHSQRKDSFSSILSWAALQGKITTSKASSAPFFTSTSQSAPANSSRPRRHSHSASTETKTKARKGSSTFRRLSLSTSTTTYDEAGTKTRHSKTSTMAPDPKASPGTSKTAKPPPCTADGKTTTPARPQSAQDKPSRPPGSSVAMPKSILRISSPDSSRRPRQFGSPETGGEPTSPSQAPPSPSIQPSSPSSSFPPSSPIQQPPSPGATTVRFAKATIHRVEVLGGANRRLLPVKRKSKSTLTYLSPLDPGVPHNHSNSFNSSRRGWGSGGGGGGGVIQLPKTMLQNPVKLRRHQENQAAMGRYWLRTEEEEAQWRADAERRAAEDRERYRKEPASPPPVRGRLGGGGGGEGGGGLVEEGRRDTFASADASPLLDTGVLALGRVEEEVAGSGSGSGSESEDSGSDAGMKCDQEGSGLGAVNGLKEEKGRSEGASETRVETEMAGEEPRLPDVSAQASLSVPDGATSESPASEQARLDLPDLKPTFTASASQQPTAQPARLVDVLIEKQAADERAARPQSPPLPVKPQETNTTKPDTDSPKPAGSSINTASKEGSTPSPPGQPSGASSITTTNPSSYPCSSKEQLTKTTSREREKETEREPRSGTDRQHKDRDKEKQNTRDRESEKGKEREREREHRREGRLAKTVSSTTTSYRAATRDLGPEGGRTPKSYGYTSSSSSSKTGHSSSSSSRSNHLHLSGRRGGRRYFEEYKQGIAA